jgi:hypothetical protein
MKRAPIIFILLALLLLLFAPAPRAQAQTEIPPNVLPIYAVQGDGTASPLLGDYVDVYGVVTGVTSKGFYLQDPTGDGDPETSDGVFVYMGRQPKVEPGQCILVRRSFVDEYYDKTELARSKKPEEVDYCETLTVEAVDIPLARLATDPETLFERYEGMLVRMDDLQGVVEGPTKRFRDGSAEIAFVPRAVEPHLPGGRVFQRDDEDMDALMYVSSGLGGDLPGLNWGDSISVGGEPGPDDAALAILDYNFGKYQLLLLPGQQVASASEGRQPDAVASGPAAEDEITVCTFNLLGMGAGGEQYHDEATYAAQLQKRALAIDESLKGCTVIGVEELGTPEDGQNLADLLGESHGLAYEATAIEGPGTRSFEFPLTNGLLSRSDRVEVVNAELRQGCSKNNYDVRYMSGACERGTFGLFNRPPLVVDLLVNGAWGDPYPLTVIVNHWKSKGGNEEVNVVRREAQAAHVASLVQEKVDANPDARVVVLGDLNDYYDSIPVETLRTGVEPNLVHTYDFLPDLNRYTYTFNGGSQVLDHILVTPNMVDDVIAIKPIRINADYAYPTVTDPTSVHHSSDHDPVLMRLQPQTGAWLGGNVQLPGVTVQLLGADGEPVAEAVSDDNGDFRLWDVTPGDYTLRYSPPAAVQVEPAESAITLAPGANEVETSAVRHRAAVLGAGIIERQ